VRPLPLRLHPGADLRRALEEQAALASMDGAAFVLAGIGSLSCLVGGLADDRHETRLEEPFELLTLSGTLSADGAHLHLSVAAADGRVIGGHLGHGRRVRTTAEVLLVALEGWRLTRQPDAATGYRELQVSPIDPPAGAPAAPAGRSC
jgi:predicted DNA-binding protein with PD1-like motif